MSVRCFVPEQGRGRCLSEAIGDRAVCGKRCEDAGFDSLELSGSGRDELGGGADYERLFVQVRNVAYLAMLMVLVAAFFMVTKLGA